MAAEQMATDSVPMGYNFVREGDPHEYRLERRTPDGGAIVSDLFTGEPREHRDAAWMASARPVGFVPPALGDIPWHTPLLAKVLKIVGVPDVGARPDAVDLTDTEWAELQRLAADPKGG